MMLAYKYIIQNGENRERTYHENTKNNNNQIMQKMKRSTLNFFRFRFFSSQSNQIQSINQPTNQNQSQIYNSCDLLNEEREHCLIFIYIYHILYIYINLCMCICIYTRMFFLLFYTCVLQLKLFQPSPVPHTHLHIIAKNFVAYLILYNLFIYLLYCIYVNDHTTQAYAPFIERDRH